MKTPYLDNYIKSLESDRDNEIISFYQHCKLRELIEIKKQLNLHVVGCSSDLIVVELSDNEIKLITEKELKQWQEDALKFDGFEGWLVKGRLVK